MGIKHEAVKAHGEIGTAEEWNANHVQTGNHDCQQYQFLNQVIENRTDFPAGPVVGQFVYRTDLNEIYVWDGTKWNAWQPGRWCLIEKRILTVSLNSQTFDSIPTNYDELKFVVVGKTGTPAGTLTIWFNNDVAANYNAEWLQVEGAVVSSAWLGDQNNIGFDAFGTGITDINLVINQAVETREKTFYGKKIRSGEFKERNGWWQNTTSKITRIDVNVLGAGFSIGTEFYIFGRKFEQ